MTDIRSRTSRITQALIERGFGFTGRDADGGLMFSGQLQAAGTAHDVRLVADPLGQKIPQVRLINIPSPLRPVAPHISAAGDLCYAAAGSIVLDVFDPGGQVLSCCARAEKVLGEIIRNELVADLQEEFFAYWTGEFCFLDVRPSSAHRAEGLVIGLKGGPRNLVVITDDRAKSLQKLKSIGYEADERFSLAVRRVKTTVLPRPRQDHWPPKTVSELLHWQGIQDPGCRKRIDKTITDAFQSGARELVCLVDSPKISYGFIVVSEGDPHAPAKPSRNGARQPRSARELAYKAKVRPVTSLPIDDAYIAQRNSPGQKTLACRRIVLVGCGTIGGYLADLLVKAGAGTEGGELTLVDNDTMMPQNVGRHRLGFNSVFLNKADALAGELARAAPTAQIRALPVNALGADLSGHDFIIDATGEEALGHLLTEKFKGNRFIPTLTVSIEGPGTAVRGVLRDVPHAACPRCLSDANRTALYPIVQEAMPSTFAGYGCESLYVPFPATVSLQAACLGAQMMSSWANCQSSPRLRTRILDEALTKASADQNPARQAECPACRP